jgi:hypothetical protein
VEIHAPTDSPVSVVALVREGVRGELLANGVHEHRLGDLLLQLHGSVAAARSSLPSFTNTSTSRKALRHPPEFTTAGWMVAVSNPGTHWNQVAVRARVSQVASRF